MVAHRSAFRMMTPTDDGQRRTATTCFAYLPQ
jgi:hypothetical protein